MASWIHEGDPPVGRMVSARFAAKLGRTGVGGVDLAGGRRRLDKNRATNSLNIRRLEMCFRDRP
jgi:hypothetical protein